MHTRTQRPHRDWDKTVFEPLLWRYGSAVACRRGRGFGCSRLGYGKSPLGRGCHQPHHRATRTYTGLRKQTPGGHKQKLMHTRTQEKGAVTPQETDPDLPMSVQESPVGWWWSAAGLRALSVPTCMGSLREVTIIFITSTIV